MSANQIGGFFNRLEASRKYRWDLELDEYNNQGLEPSDVEARVRALTHATQ